MLLSIVKLFLLLTILNFTEAELSEGKCPEIEEPFKCYDHFTKDTLVLGTPVAFLPAAIEAEALSLFSFNITNIDNKRGYFICTDNGVFFKERLEVSILYSLATEYPLKRLGATVSIHNEMGTPLLRQLKSGGLWNSLECANPYGDSAFYKYFIRYQRDSYLLIFGCYQLNEILHDRGLWIFSTDSHETDQSILIEMALSESNLTHLGLETSKNMIVSTNVEIEEESEGGYYDDVCEYRKLGATDASDSVRAHGGHKNSFDRSNLPQQPEKQQQIQMGLSILVISVGAAIFVLICVKLVCK